MKIKSFCIIENCDGSPYVTVYPYSEDGLKAAQNQFEEIAKENGIEEDIEYNLDPSNTDSIANVSNGESWDLVLIVSQ